MTNLAQAIEQAQTNNEKKLAASIQAPSLDIDSEALSLLRDFANWCKERGVKCLPCAPTTAAAFIKHESAAGVSADRILTALEAIEAAHSGLSNPIRNKLADEHSEVAHERLAGLLDNQVDQPAGELLGGGGPVSDNASDNSPGWKGSGRKGPRYAPKTGPQTNMTGWKK